MSVELVGLAGEQGARFEFLREGRKARDLAFELAFDRLTLARQVEVRIDIALPPLEFVRVREQRFQALAVAHDGLRKFGVGPESGVGELLFYRAELAANAGGVKDTPAGR